MPPSRLLPARQFYISALPPELLSEIFLNLTALQSENQRKIVATLSLVCCRWKGIAYATPRLWTHCACSSFGKSPAFDRFKSLILASRLSGSHSLYLALRSDHYAWTKLRETLSIVASKVHHLDLYLTVGAAITALQTRININSENEDEHHWDRLETMKLVLQQRRRGRLCLVPLLSGKDATMGHMPRLVDLTLEGAQVAGFLLAGLKPTFPWSQLTRLEINTQESQTHVFAILRQCHSLEDCHLHFKGHLSSEVSDEIFLPRLRSLTFYVNPLVFVFTPEAFLDCFKLPALEKFSMKLDFPGDWFPPIHVTSLLQKCRSTLRELVLENLLLSEQEYIELLKDLVNLEELTVRNHEVRCLFLIHGLNRGFLPRLVKIRLELGQDAEDGYLAALFHDFVASRTCKGGGSSSLLTSGNLGEFSDLQSWSLATCHIDYDDY
ncbi:hypothetical protein EST38_g2343 [Candolleomyces aberdarensis]|uniref:F-box domain-containing protein n=1 Tax=Candolleomyces aberdarensis TaxID=2316362 RepID=A0A4Q2DUV5_9AGAR|nr:hypothetical protein EST38_g2343 [Candolleomyces aberdarensis]